MGLVTSIGGWEAATLYAAARLDARSLGAPLWVFLEHPLYAPWKWWIWQHAFGHGAPAFFRTAACIAYGATIAGWLLAALCVRLFSSARVSTSYGSARWSAKKELRAAGLGERGVVLCQTADAQYRAVQNSGVTRWLLKRLGELVCDNSDLHVLGFAPTGTGKGAGMVVPTLLSWTHSVVTTDPKGELYAITAGWRRSFSHVIRFEPTSPDSCRYNPLFTIPRGEDDVREAQNIAEVLVPKDERGKRDHWQLTAYKLLVGAILHVLYAGVKKDLRGVLELLTDPERSIREVLQDMMRTPHLGDRPHPQVVSAARAALNKSDNELSGVVSTAETCLDLWLDPIVARNTSRSDFCAEQLNSLTSPVSLYLVVPTRDIERLRPLIRLMLIQLGNRLTAQVHVPEPPKRSLRENVLAFLGRLRAAFRGWVTGFDHPTKQRVLFLIDEFPVFGYLPWIEAAIAYLRGYRIKLFLIAQSLNQIEKIYGPNHAFIDNCSVRVTYTANDERTARRISDMLGQRTVTQRRESYSKKKSALFFESVTTAEQEHARPLLTPGEISTLAQDEAIVFAGGTQPYRGKKIMYYLDPRFAPRANLPTPDSTEEREAELPVPCPASEWTSLKPIAASRAASSEPEKPLSFEGHDEVEALGSIHDDGVFGGAGPGDASDPFEPVNNDGVPL